MGHPGSPLFLDLLAAGVSVALLARNLPRLFRRRGPDEGRAVALVPAVNVVLALAVLAYAVKGVFARLI